jgi:AcrR family transcriptional regulator
MSISGRRARHRASLRREILDAASSLFVEEGYRRLTMRRIAERIDYSPTTIYLHFKNKHELLEAVCEETLSQFAATLERLKTTPTSPLTYLRESLRGYVEFGIAHPNQYMVAFGGHDPSVQENRPDSSHSFGGLALGTLQQALKSCADHGDIQATDLDSTAQALWAAVHGLTSLLITMPGSPLVARAVLVDHTIDTLLAGLKQPAPVTPRVTPAPRRARSDFFD